MNSKRLQQFEELLRGFLDRCTVDVKNMESEVATPDPCRKYDDIDCETFVTVGLIESSEKRIQDIRVALEKIVKGEFGICEHCKKVVGLKRLEVQPTAKLCIKCKQAEENEV